MPAVISVENLCKRYTTYKRGEKLSDTVKSFFSREKVLVDAVKGISFEVAEGEIIGLLGENGAGKSTTLKILTGVLFPTSGQVRVLGYVPFEQRIKYVRHIGAVFGQKSQLIWDIPPLDSFELNRAIYDIPADAYKKRLDMMTDCLGLGDVIKRPTRVLSLGERMKCEFIMAMLHSPSVVFLDEPTIGVDIIAKDAIRGFIREMNAQGVTFILTTHDLEDVASLARRVIIINHGEKVFEDSLDTLRHHLGDRKTIAVTMKTDVAAMPPPPDGMAPPVQTGKRELSLVVDTAAVSMSSCIAYLSQAGEIADMSIKEIGIDAVVKSIYAQQHSKSD